MHEYAYIIHNLSIYYVNYNDTCFLLITQFCISYVELQQKMKIIKIE